jgi:hypothetical protein
VTPHSNLFTINLNFRNCLTLIDLYDHSSSSTVNANLIESNSHDGPWVLAQAQMRRCGKHGVSRFPFREYGIDVDHLQPTEAGARVPTTPMAVEMVDALDQWAFVRRVANPRDTSKAHRLSAVAKAADLEP